MKQMMRMAWAALALGLGLLAAPAQAHEVKDPVCRMTVDSDTAKYQHKLGNKSFYFCSKQCVERFKKEPAKYEKLAEQLEKQDLHQYEVDFKSSQAVAGKPVQMEFGIRYADTKKPVTDFEVIHERLLHLVMTSEDLAWFEHQHPVRGEDGLFRITWTFPRAGKYRLYADFTPSDGDNQVIPVSLEVGGGPARTVPLTPDVKRVKQVGNLRFEVAVRGEPLQMEKPMLLTYRITDLKGRPVRNIQPFIGAMGHLLAISADGKEVVHTHALQTTSQPTMHGEKEPFRVTREMVTEKGPAFTFKTTLPTSGLYKTWAQFMHGNRVYTVPFTFYVRDLWARAAPASPRGVQRVAITIADGKYTPAKVEVKAGQPVELVFTRKEEFGCGDVLMLPTLGVKKTLKPGQSTTVRFTPKRSGAVPFTCGMKMYRGQVAVR